MDLFRRIFWCQAEGLVHEYSRLVRFDELSIHKQNLQFTDRSGRIEYSTREYAIWPREVTGSIETFKPPRKALCEAIGGRGIVGLLRSK